jgi:Ni/Co efflux regulator RcnB
MKKLVASIVMVFALAGASVLAEGSSNAGSSSAMDRRHVHRVVHRTVHVHRTPHGVHRTVHRTVRRSVHHK